MKRREGREAPLAAWPRSLSLSLGAAAAGDGGSLTIGAGSSAGGTGGDVSVAAGSGGTGGKVEVCGGDGSAAAGGAVVLQSGASSAGASGSVVVGSSDSGAGGASGDVSFGSGAASGGSSGSLTLSTGASSGGRGGSVAIGAGAGDSGAGAAGASKVLHVSDDLKDEAQLAQAVAAAAEAEGADLVVAPHDHVGRAVAPRVAVRLKAGMVPGVTGLLEGATVQRNVFSGKAMAHVSVHTDRTVLTTTPNAFGVNQGEGQANVESFAPELEPAKLTVTGFDASSEDGSVPLPEAVRVVSAGRGLKGPEHWGIVEELAQALEATTAPFPIVHPGCTMLCPPIRAPSPILTGASTISPLSTR